MVDIHVVHKATGNGELVVVGPEVGADGGGGWVARYKSCPLLSGKSVGDHVSVSCVAHETDSTVFVGDHADTGHISSSVERVRDEEWGVAPGGLNLAISSDVGWVLHLLSPLLEVVAELDLVSTILRAKGIGLAEVLSIRVLTFEIIPESSGDLLVISSG